jgi:hypothetical protein
MNAIDTIELKPEERTRCEIWTRVMGYHRPVSAFNAGKRSEHEERRCFVERSPQGHGMGRRLGRRAPPQGMVAA